MAYTPRDVIVYLTDYPWKFLVKNHNGIVTRTLIATYSKVTNRRNIFPGGFAQLGPSPLVGGATGAAAVIAPPGTIPAKLGIGGLAVVGDDVLEAGGVTGHAPKPEVFNRYQLTFQTAAVTGGTAETPIPYQCWEDEFRSLGDIDLTNELNN